MSRTIPAPGRLLLAFRNVVAVALVASLAGFVGASWHWPLVGDAPLFHYVVSLLRQGQVPYRDFIDINLPGTYAIQGTVIALVGSGALAWRVFDLGLLAAIGPGMLVLCRGLDQPRRPAWFPALFAATLFSLLHGRDGLIETGQRDLMIAALWIWACALALVTLRSKGAQALAAAALCGLALGAACTIKPSALLLLPAVLAILVWQSGWRRHWLLVACAALPAPLASVGYLVHEHALAAFWSILTQLAPYHAWLGRRPFAALAGSIIASTCIPLTALWLAVFFAQRRYKRREDQLLLAGFAVGVASYVMQGRGYPYHRYPSEVFLLLLMAIAFSDALWPAEERGAPRWVRGIALAGLALGALFVVPRSLEQVLRFDPTDPFTTSLEASLLRLGTPATLDRRVQCLDTASGCLNTLQQMHLVQTTGFLYDCYLYPNVEPPAGPLDRERTRYRAAFAEAITAHPPEFLIVTSNECGGPPDSLYRKLERWDWLRNRLGTDYNLIEDVAPPGLVRWGGKPAPPVGYRIYRLRP